jgi:hypothetical protein
MQAICQIGRNVICGEVFNWTSVEPQMTINSPPIDVQLAINWASTGDQGELRDVKVEQCRPAGNAPDLTGTCLRTYP